MGGTKYHFNPATLSFEKKRVKPLKSVLIGMGTLILIISGALGIAFLILSYFDTPQMKSLREENKQLLAQYNHLYEKLGQIESVLDEIQVRDDNIYRVIFEKNPIPESVRKAGFGGTNRYAGLESFNDAEIVLNTSRKIDIVSKQAYIQAKSYEEVLNLALTKDQELSSMPAIMPISNHDLTFTSSGWGMRIHPIYKVPMFHWGIDFVAPRGTNVYASGDGIIEAVNTERTGHGKHIIVDHGFGFKTLYAHMSKFNVKKGQKVKRGEIIGYVGNTGTSTAPHLHYEVEKNGKKVDPKYYFFKDLTPEKFDELVAISSNMGQSFD